MGLMLTSSGRGACLQTPCMVATLGHAMQFWLQGSPAVQGRQKGLSSWHLRNQRHTACLNIIDDMDRGSRLGLEVGFKYEYLPQVP